MNPETGKLSGALGAHVDDGIHGCDVHPQIQKLETGSKISSRFKEIQILHVHRNRQQFPDNGIQLSHAKYVNGGHRTRTTHAERPGWLSSIRRRTHTP